MLSDLSIVCDDFVFFIVLLFISLCPFKFSINLKRKRKLVALFLSSYRCLVVVNVLRLFLTVLWVGLQCLIVMITDHTLLLSCTKNKKNS